MTLTQLTSQLTHVSSVRNGTLDYTSRFTHSFHTHNQVRQVVQRVKDPEDVHSILNGQLTKPKKISSSFISWWKKQMRVSLKNDIVRIACVTNCIGTPEKHLEWNVGDAGPHFLQSLPGTLVQKSHCNIESCPSPVFYNEKHLFYMNNWYQGQ